MIITVCTDDPEVENIAEASHQANPAIYGACYKVFERPIPDLAQDEDLFITAHGAAMGDENQPVIGSQSNDFYLTARDLNSNLHVFPSGYKGCIYISTCESADPGGEGFSFAEKYKEILQPSFPQISVFGHRGEVDKRIPLPGDPSWVRV